MTRSEVLVYVAGPYRAATKGDVTLNVLRASGVAKQILALGFSVICPHTMMDGWQFDEVLEDADFLRNGLEQLRHCDLMYVFAEGVEMPGGWFASEGTVAEIAEASKRGIPAFSSIEALLAAYAQEKTAP